ncbi:MAG: lipocalin family protein [Spirochaetes bacterium]|nr:lipocalin family protein [Spirochaetota bacterium]
MKKISILIIIILFLLTSCSVTTVENIDGLWQVTHRGVLKVTEDGYYYLFEDDSKNFYRSSKESDLIYPITEYDDIKHGTYTLSEKQLTLTYEEKSDGDDLEVNAYTRNNGTTMIWYIGIHTVRLEKQ